MREPALAALLVLFAACDIPSDAPTEPKTDNASPPVQKPRDETRRFPSQDRIRVEIIDDQILGKEFLPGGNLAFYERNGKKWRQFLLLMLAKYCVGAKGAATVSARHSLCPKTTLYSAGINRSGFRHDSGIAAE